MMALGFSLLALLGAWKGLERARRSSEPRIELVQRIRHEAGPRDLVVFTDEAPDLVALASPVPALWGPIPLHDLGGVRRLYAVSTAAPPLVPFLARFGAARPVGRHALAWELEGAATVRFDLLASLLTGVSARREGGVDDGPCPVQGNVLACHGPPWNHVRVENHRFEGTELQCVFAHPQADGRLVLSLEGLPPVRALVGVVGIDDAGWFPTGAPVVMRVDFQGEGAAPVTQEVVARNRKGLTPYRVALPGRAGGVRLTVSTPNAGARQFCFTLYATE